MCYVHPRVWFSKAWQVHKNSAVTLGQSAAVAEVWPQCPALSSDCFGITVPLHEPLKLEMKQSKLATFLGLQRCPSLTVKLPTTKNSAAGSKWVLFSVLLYWGWWCFGDPSLSLQGRSGTHELVGFGPHPPGNGYTCHCSNTRAPTWLCSLAFPKFEIQTVN